MPVTIRDRRTADNDAVRRVVTDAFADDGLVADLTDALARRSDAQPQFVATDGDDVVGLVGLSRSWVDAPGELLRVLVLSPLAVTPARHGEGIGRLLLDAAVVGAEELGAPLVFLEGDPGYYRRHGWSPAGDLGFVAPSPRIPPPAFQVRTLAGYDPARMSGPLVYNDTFWEFDCVGLR